MLILGDVAGGFLKCECHELAYRTPNNQAFCLSQTLTGILAFSVSSLMKNGTRFLRVL